MLSIVAGRCNAKARLRPSKHHPHPTHPLRRHSQKRIHQIRWRPLVVLLKSTTSKTLSLTSLQAAPHRIREWISRAPTTRCLRTFTWPTSRSKSRQFLRYEFDTNWSLILLINLPTLHVVGFQVPNITTATGFLLLRQALC